ncbi:MAG: HAD-IA family hydrolase [Gammaproteobacteria bacterium]|nr:HAD-IA family hydrolase [Gammaproteobacteria bacterium]
MRKNRYHLLVFDWDGTLMDSAARIVDCLRFAIRQSALPDRTEQQLRHIIGLGLNELVDYLFPEGIDSVKRRTFIDAYRHQFIEANATPAYLFEGVREMLENFSVQGYQLAIATGKSRAGLVRSLRDQSMEALFPVSRCADECRSKPDPAMLNEILSDCDLSASAALMIGDTEFDIEMAQRAGVDAVAVSQGVHSEQQLRQAKPLAILEHIRQLPQWLDNRLTFS